MTEISDEMAFVLSFALVILMKIVCFVLGYLTVLLGYRLIKSGVKGEFKFSAKLGGVKTDLASVSPGLLFVLLGVVLIGYAMYVEKGVVLERKEQKQPPAVLLPKDGQTPFNDITKENQGGEK